MAELSAEQIVELSLRHTLYDWQQQGTTTPLAIERAKGCEFFTVDGKRYLHFNSQLMGVNIGHADPRVAEAIAEQARTLPYITPFAATEVRALLGQKMAELLPGEWFAVNRWGVVPDIIAMAKGLTSSYVPLGAVGLRPNVSSYFDEHVFWGGLTYNSHPLALAAALATIRVYEEDGLLEHTRKMGEVMARHHAELKDKHASVGLVRNLGLFGILELVRNRSMMEPMAPFNGTSDEMKAIGTFLDEKGLFTMIRWNGIMTNPPLPITEEQLAEGFAIIDEALTLHADPAVTG